MKLIIIHYHLRPGGIRRIIELATPHLLQHLNGHIDEVVLAVGDAPDRKWNKHFVAQSNGVPVRFFIDPAFNYLSEQTVSPSKLKPSLRGATNHLLDSNDCIVWAHNGGIGRNLLMVRELSRACDERGIQLVMHHHDWWFDNRWLRWPEMKRFGIKTLKDAARIIFPSSQTVHHVAINCVDARLLRKHFPKRAGWVPNLTEPSPPPSRTRVRATRQWLARKLQTDAPVWLLPCRLLRRKNVAEALLLARWLRPEAWLVTTGSVSSADEKHYHDKLAAAGHRHHWRLRLSILAGDETDKPGVAELMAASEAVILTSVQEGFGLPYLEAAAARRPLIARSIPNIAPDLDEFGFRFPQYYDELLIAPGLFDWSAERKHQSSLFQRWRNRLPKSCRDWAGTPVLLETQKPRPVPFSRLTLSAQLEVLSHPAQHSWELCAPLNPFLKTWKSRAASRRLKITPWPKSANAWLSGKAYAKRFSDVLAEHMSSAPSKVSAPHAQEQFIREKLHAGQLFPLLWSRNT